MNLKGPGKFFKEAGKLIGGFRIRPVFALLLSGFILVRILFLIPGLVDKINYTVKIFYKVTHSCFPHFTGLAFIFIFLIPYLLVLAAFVWLCFRWLTIIKPIINKVLPAWLKNAINGSTLSHLFVHLLLFIVYSAVLGGAICFILYTSPLPGRVFNDTQLLLGKIFFLLVEVQLAVLFFLYFKKSLQLLLRLVTRRWKEGMLLLISLTISLTVIEFGLRKIFSIKPGVFIVTPWFHKVDTLICMKGLYADSDGIFKAIPEMHLKMHNEIITHTPDSLPDWPDPHKREAGEFSLDRDFLTIFLPGFDNDFVQMVKRTQQMPVNQRTELDNAILHYMEYPINSEGFPSIEMVPLQTKKKKILLLGDSFTWGHASSNKTNSFANILLAKGYAVYNTGISGADPAQYLAVAKKYIPLLKPDIVIVNFFLGNDIFYFRRPVLAYRPYNFVTNAGWLLACPDGIYFDSAQQAYDMITAYYSIPAENNWFNWICSKTATGTVAWRVLEKFKLVDRVPARYRPYAREAGSLLYKKPYSNIQVDSIKIISESYHARFMLVTIPDVLDKALSDPKKIPYLFEGLDYYTSPVKKEGYDSKYWHFNDAGHKQYAEFLDSLIRLAP